MSRKDPARILRDLPSVAGGLLVLIACLGAGYGVQALTQLPVPPSVIGLALYAALLLFVPGAERLTKPAAGLLVRLLGALIVPPFVALWLFRETVAADAAPILLILTATSIASAFVTAAVYRQLTRA